MPAKVLVADDSPTIRRRAQTTLSEAGYQVTCVEDGQAAWAALEGPETFQVLLCDILMPGIDGYELCHRVKSTQRLAGLPVLLLRGTFEPWDQAKAVDAGADGYVTKPFDAEALLSTLGEVLADVGGAPLAVAPSEPLAAPAPPAEPEAPAPVPIEAWAPKAEEPSVEAASSPFADEPAVASPPVAEEPLAASPFGPDAEGPSSEPLVFDSGSDSPLGDGPLGDSPLDLGPAPLAAAETGPPEPQPAEPLSPVAPIQEPWAPAAADPLSPPGPSAPSIAAAFEPARTAPAAPAGSSAPISFGGLDEATLEKIAERVAARLVGRELERIAWDVVPDVAEAVIRKRLAEIEAHLGDE